MKPMNYEFGGGVNHTIMHPAVMVATVVTILLMFVLPRKYVIIPFLLCVFLVPRGQQLYVAGMHWYVALRILMLAGLVLLARSKFQVAGGLNGIDKAFILWAVCRGVCQMLLFPQRGMVIYQAAFWLEALGGYFLLRYLIQDEEDIARAAKTLAVLAVILGACMLNEHIHHVNVFGYLGGAPITPKVRDGLVRAQAIFGYPILAGCFGATLAPLFFWLWKSGRAKVLAAAGIGGSMLMALMSISSTPLFAYLAGVGALFLWPIRRSMRAVRWGIVLTLVALTVVMREPVWWFVIAHTKVIRFSEGYHRALLLDNFFMHIRDWWLIGTNQNEQLGIWYVGHLQPVCGRRGERRIGYVHLLYCYDFAKFQPAGHDEAPSGERSKTGMVLLEPWRHHGRSCLRLFRGELLGPNGNMVVGLPGHDLGCYRRPANGASES